MNYNIINTAFFGHRWKKYVVDIQMVPSPSHETKAVITIKMSYIHENLKRPETNVSNLVSKDALKGYQESTMTHLTSQGATILHILLVVQRAKMVTTKTLDEYVECF